MISFVGGQFTADPDLDPPGPTKIDDSQSFFTLDDDVVDEDLITFDGGTLRLSGGSFGGNIVPSAVTVEDGGAFVDTSTGNGGFSGPSSGAGGLSVEGGGRIALRGDTSFSGGEIGSARCGERGCWNG